MTVVVIGTAPSKADLAKARLLAAEIKPKPLDVHQLLDLIRTYLPEASAA